MKMEYRANSRYFYDNRNSLSEATIAPVSFDFIKYGVDYEYLTCRLPVLIHQCQDKSKFCQFCRKHITSFNSIQQQFVETLRTSIFLYTPFSTQTIYFAPSYRYQLLLLILRCFTLQNTLSKNIFRIALSCGNDYDNQCFEYQLNQEQKQITRWPSVDVYYFTPKYFDIVGTCEICILFGMTPWNNLPITERLIICMPKNVTTQHITRD